MFLNKFLRLIMQNFPGIIFTGTQTFGDIFKSALVYLYWGSNFRNRILTNYKMELVIRICEWNCCQSFSENLLLGTLIICSVNALFIWDENTFIKDFYTNYSFFNGIWHYICFKLGSIVAELNIYLFIFPPKKYIFCY